MQSPEPLLEILSDRNYDELSEQSWTLCDNVFAPDFYELMLSECKRREEIDQEFRQSQIGKGQKQQSSAEIRNDLISWVEFKQNSAFTEVLKSKLDQIQQDLNQGLYLGIDHYECHFAKYPAGSFYKTHIDQAKTMTHLDGERVISFVLYLNKNWVVTDGGQLQIEMPHKSPTLIDPQFGRLILFRSDTVPHAVLESKNLRRSLTGWMRKTRVS